MAEKEFLTLNEFCDRIRVSSQTGYKIVVYFSSRTDIATRPFRLKCTGPEHGDGPWRIPIAFIAQFEKSCREEETEGTK